MNLSGKITAVAAALMLSGCISITVDGELFEEAEEIRHTPSFDKISNIGSVDLHVTVGQPLQVVVRGGTQDIDAVVTNVVDGELRISREHGHRIVLGFASNPEVIVSVPSLKALELIGANDTSAVNINADEFHLMRDGSGDTRLSGTCVMGHMNHEGSGDLRARRLQCQNVTLVHEGSGDVSFFASVSVSVDSHGSGDVDLFGGPVINHLRTEGSGDFSPR